MGSRRLTRLSCAVKQPQGGRAQVKAQHDEIEVGVMQSCPRAAMFHPRTVCMSLLGQQAVYLHL